MGGDKSAGEINDAQVERDVEAVAAQYDLIAVAERIDESAMEMVLAHELGVEYGLLRRPLRARAGRRRLAPEL